MSWCCTRGGVCRKNKYRDPFLSWALMNLWEYNGGGTCCYCREGGMCSRGWSWNHKLQQRRISPDDMLVALSIVSLLTWIPNLAASIATAFDTSAKIYEFICNKMLIDTVPLSGGNKGMFSWCTQDFLMSFPIVARSSFSLQAFDCKSVGSRWAWLFRILHCAVRWGLEAELQEKKVQREALQFSSLVGPCNTEREGLWITFIGARLTKGKNNIASSFQPACSQSWSVHWSLD